MKKYYATQLKSSPKSLNGDFENIVKKEEFLVYLGQGIDMDIEVGQESVFIDDIGRGGGGITEWGEIYSAVKYMATLYIQGILVNALYDLLKKYFISAIAIFRKSKHINETFHFNIDVENNSQYHFVFFSYIDENDFENAWDAMPNFVVNNQISPNNSVDCYFDTKSKKWNVVGKRELDHEHVAKYKIY